MKRKITFSIALALSVVLLTLMTSDMTVKAQPGGLRPIADTGVLTLGPNQILRISGDGVDQDDVVTLRFRRIGYAQGACSGGVCKHTVESQINSGLITVTPSEAVWMDIDRTPGSSAVRVVLLSNSRKVRVSASIVNTLTGEVVAFTTDLVIDVSGY